MNRLAAGLAAPVAALALLAGALAPGRARASVEEFTSFDVSRMEEDDENFLDHWETRPLEAWRDEWERTNGGFRSSQGCFTAGIWHMETDFKSRAPLGEKSFLDIAWHQTADMESNYEWLNLDFRRAAGRLGTFGIRFRPAYDKSQQDFAALWEHGDGASAFQVQATFTIEDAFNSLWEFRQIRVGNHGEPYRAHPVEPALRVVSRGAHHRVELAGTWLTPSRKLVLDPDPAQNGSLSLWGSKEFAQAAAWCGGWGVETRFEDQQVASAADHVGVPGNAHSFRRRWVAEGALRRTLAPHWRAEARLLYQDRFQDWSPPDGDGTFRAIDRMQTAELDWDATDRHTFRFGIMHDRIGVVRQGAYHDFSYGSRKESRAFIGLQARFGRVHVQGLEGIELDREPYQVSFHHDKGFLSLQTTF